MEILEQVDSFPGESLNKVKEMPRKVEIKLAPEVYNLLKVKAEAKLLTVTDMVKLAVAEFLGR